MIEPQRNSSSYSAKNLFTVSQKRISAVVSSAVMVRKSGEVQMVEKKSDEDSTPKSSQPVVSTPSQTPKRTQKIDNFS